MDFEQFSTPIIIMIIWVASNAISKIVKADRKAPATADQKTGFLESLLQNLAGLEEKDRSEAVIELDEYFQPTSSPPLVVPGKKSLIEIAEGPLPQETAPAPRKMPTGPSAINKAKANAAMAGKTPGMANRRKLQNAIIWAEILAPPVALREH